MRVTFAVLALLAPSKLVEGLSQEIDQAVKEYRMTELGMEKVSEGQFITKTVSLRKANPGGMFDFKGIETMHDGGSFGLGGGHQKFNDRAPNDSWYTRKVTACTLNNRVGSIKMEIKNDQSQETRKFEQHGRGKDNCQTLEVKQDPIDCINQVIVRSGKYVDSVTFVKNNGEFISVGGRQGQSHNASYNTGYCLCGVKGRNGSLIDEVSFWFCEAKKRTKTNSRGQTSIVMTKGYGGTGGHFFKLTPPMTQDEQGLKIIDNQKKLRQIAFVSDKYLDSIQLSWTSLKDGSIPKRVKMGGDGGKKKQTLVIPNDACITQVWFKTHTDPKFRVPVAMRFKDSRGNFLKEFNSENTIFGSEKGDKGKGIWQIVQKGPTKCLVGMTGTAGRYIDSFNFLFLETGEGSASRENTLGYWKLIQSSRKIEYEITISAYTTAGKELTEEQSNEFQSTHSAGASVTVGKDFGFVTAEASFTYEYTATTTDTKTSAQTVSSEITSGHDKTLKAFCDDETMKYSPKQGQWALWQWNLLRPAQNIQGRQLTGFKAATQYIYCTGDLKVPPKYPPEECWGYECQKKRPSLKSE